MNKKLLACAFIALFHLSSHAIEGTYLGTGIDPYLQKPYTSKTVITKDLNDVYQATWNEEEDGEKYTFTGTGLKVGDQVNFIFKGVSVEDSLTIGLQNYKISGNTLEGSFVYLNKNLVGKEKLVKQ